MVCPSKSLNLLGYSSWGYYSWCGKPPVGSGRRLSAIGDFPSNFSQEAVLAFELLDKLELVSRPLDHYVYFDFVFSLSDVSIWASV